MKYVKFDMHTHNSDGSVDAHISAQDSINVLKAKGFGGMLISDHDSYNGYEAVDFSEVTDFTVLKGIEYDTSDFGHFLVILPDGVDVKVLNYRGLKLEKLIYIVHKYGGVLGAAHPCGETFLSYYDTGIRHGHYYKMMQYIAFIDFFEGYNASEDTWRNVLACKVAKKYNIPVTGGSDAHKEDCLGLGYTYLPDYIKTNTDFIRYIKKKPHNKIGGRQYGKTTKDKLGPFNKLLVAGFYFYNKFEALINLPFRIIYRED